jgi:hypothetical protein
MKILSNAPGVKDDISKEELLQNITLPLPFRE